MEIGPEENISNILIIKINKPTLVNLKMDPKLKNQFIKRYKKNP